MNRSLKIKKVGDFLFFGIFFGPLTTDIFKETLMIDIFFN